MFCFLLLGHHELSIYPKKELPFFILFTAALCSFTAMLALLTHQFPEPMANAAKTVSDRPISMYSDARNWLLVLSTESRLRGLAFAPVLNCLYALELSVFLLNILV